jgi:uncharacterized protein YcgL (UPF0745 family)
MRARRVGRYDLVLIGDVLVEGGVRGQRGGVLMDEVEQRRHLTNDFTELFGVSKRVSRDIQEQGSYLQKPHNATCDPAHGVHLAVR